MNNYIINKSVRNDYIKEKERSSYRYGMDVLILNLIPIFIILVILVVTRNIEFAILFLLFFIPICSTNMLDILIFYHYCIGRVDLKRENYYEKYARNIFNRSKN